MNRPSRRANLYLLVLSTTYVSTVVCQNVLLEETRLSSQPHIIDTNREIITTNQVCPKAQLMNTLFSIASGKNGLPELTSTAPSVIQDKQYATLNQNQRPSLCNVVSMSPQTSTFIPKESISIGQPVITTTSLPQPAIPTNSMSNIVMGTTIPSAYSAAYSAAYPPTIVPAAPCSISRSPKPPQVIPLDNYANMVQYPAVWQMPQTNDFYSYNSQPAVVYTEPTQNSQNWKISSPSSVINTDPGNYDIRTSCISDISVPEPAVIMNDYDQGLPFNVQINVPPTNTPAPRITLVSTAPAPSAQKPDPYPSYPPFSYPPPLIIRNSRSSWKNILPIILIAMFSDQESYGGCCCPCNCCSCNCNSDSPTPIPYPIPIPVNNPIINNAGSSKYSSRRRENIPNHNDKDN